ncbi:VQ motif-containing protein 10-like [Impatiens glandulifera]|uniref:VQ motif-containing protein 10-like n=1 Tax=Impatiens glandulifera TaxID=253017 RepID=UPI001FB11A8B|nr:VQ motif-containing protein 10-like [Impatiens glandulifera]
MKRGHRSVVETPVKVVIIDTQYVETDACNFKSVVQQLTGKDATAASQAKYCAAKLASRSSSGGIVAGAGGSCGEESFLSRGLSFKHFDGLLMDLPHLDELLSASFPVWR